MVGLLSKKITQGIKMNHNHSMKLITKRVFALFVAVIFVSASSFAQKKPTIMILPSDNWCTQRYFTTSFQNQGTTITISNYQQAFTEDNELPQVVSRIGALLTDLGYSLKDAEQELKNITVKTAEDNVISSKTSGATLLETPLDELKRKVKSDIIIQLWWKINRETQGKSASFTMEAFDTYTNKRIATSTGNTKPSAQSIDVILGQAIEKQIKPFDEQMTRWYHDQEINGREISLTIRCWDNWEEDLETEFGGDELIDCIQDWLYQNCVNGKFNYSDGTESFAQFEQVRIPLTDESGRSMDARAFATNLRKYLRQSPYNITSKVAVRGLGEASIILGEK